jgi:hypothetical protein
MKESGKASIFAATVLAIAANVSAAMADLKNENLLTPLPNGFKVGFETKKDQMDMAEYVPVAETVEDWSTMITVQIFHGARNVDPDAFAGDLAKRCKAACAAGDARKVTAGAENGYSFSLWIYKCPLNPGTGKPENMWLKTTSGADSLYSVQYAYRRALVNDLIGPAMDYLRHVKVCDARRADRPCPDGM